MSLCMILVCLTGCALHCTSCLGGRATRATENRLQRCLDTWIAIALQARALTAVWKPCSMRLQSCCPVLQELHDIVKQCLQKDPALRPTCAQLLKHKFFKVPPFSLAICLLPAHLPCPVSQHTTYDAAHGVGAFAHNKAHHSCAMAPLVCLLSCSILPAML